MRYLIAAVLFVAALVSGLLGLGDRTIWAPPASHNISVSIDTTAPYVVVPAKVLSAYPGKPQVTALSKGAAFVAYGRENDVRAWIGNAHVLDLKLGESAAGVTTIEPATDRIGITGTNPSGSDLWVEESRGQAKTSLVMTTRSDTAALIAADGIGAAPGQIDFVWPIAHDLTYSNTMLYIAAGTALAALVMLIIAMRHARIKRGPRRRTPKPPKGKRIKVRANKELVKGRGRRSARNPIVGRVATGVTALALTASLAGCSLQLPGVAGDAAKASATPSVAPTQNVQPPAAVTRVQLERILADVASVASKADKANNRAMLTSRFAGPAFKLRSVNYVLRKKSKSIEAPLKIAATPITFSLPAATDTWPRTIMAVTDEPGQTNLPQMIVLQQANPRENYKVWYVSRLLPGIKIPAVPTEDMGAIPVDAKSVFLKLAPNQLASAFGDVINKGRSSQSAGLFNLANPFYEQVSTGQKAQTAALTDAKITFQHSLGDVNTLALATADSGALVAVFMNDVYTIKPAKAGAAVAIDGQEKLLLGTGGSTSGVRSIYGDMLFFYVPPVTSKKPIELLGATQGLLTIKKL